MWEYLAQNMKAGVNLLVLINLWIYGSSAVTQHGLYQDLFNQNGMDLSLKYLSVKPRLQIYEKMLILATDRGWKSARETFYNLR